MLTMHSALREQYVGIWRPVLTPPRALRPHPPPHPHPTEPVLIP